MSSDRLPDAEDTTLVPCPICPIPCPKCEMVEGNTIAVKVGVGLAPGTKRLTVACGACGHHWHLHCLHHEDSHRDS